MSYNTNDLLQLESIYNNIKSERVKSPQDMYNAILLNESPVAPVKPDTKPAPTTRPTPKPKRENPLAPKPGKAPKPKAEFEEELDPVGKEDDDIDNDGDSDSTDKYLLKRREIISKAVKESKNKKKRIVTEEENNKISPDVAAFIKARMVTEEEEDNIDQTYFDPTKKQLYGNKEKDYVNQVLPDLNENEQNYLDVITSEAYKTTVKKAIRYLGLQDFNQLKSQYPNFPSIMMAAMGSLQKITQLERSQKSNLEKLAVDVILNLPEYDLVKRAVEEGSLKIVALLGQPDLTKALGSDELNTELDTGLTVAETINLQLNDVLEGKGDQYIKRQLANYMTQGEAINKAYLFNLVKDELDSIDNTLINNYGILVSLAHLLYYAIPNMSITSQMKSMAAGSEEVVPNEDGYTIKAIATTFPFLIHEIVKGIGDWMSLDVAEQGVLDTETLDDEIKQLMSGPELETRLRRMLPNDVPAQIIPLVKKLMYNLSVNDIKEIFSGGGRGRSIIQKLVSQANDLYNQYTDED